MSAGSGAMVIGSMLTTRKGAPANESNFTKTGNTLNYPTNFEDA